MTYFVGIDISKFKHDYCIINENGEWQCPNCGSTDKHKFSISRRVCGYLNASPDINKGKMNEFQERVKHI